MSSIENARQELTDIVGSFTWTLDEGASAALDVLAAHGTGDPADDHTLTREQEHDLLCEMKREAEAEFARSAAFNRLQRAVGSRRSIATVFARSYNEQS